MPDTLAAALDYLSRGWSIIPVVPGDKRALVKWEPYQQRLATEAQARSWWQQWPTANLGIVTGQVSHLTVLDVDPRNGGADTLDSLMLDGCALPDTPTVQTGGGGTHFYFGLSTPLRTCPALLPGLDLKATGGYVIAPPSLHPSGVRYTWLISPDQVVPQPIPKWLLAHAVGRPGAPAVHPDDPHAFWSPGERNHALTRIAGALRRQGVRPASLEGALQIVNAMQCVPPLPDSEVAAIAKSVSRYTPAPSQRQMESIIAAYKALG